jgi:hypothetical protein
MDDVLEANMDWALLAAVAVAEGVRLLLSRMPPPPPPDNPPTPAKGL